MEQPDLIVRLRAGPEEAPWNWVFQATTLDKVAKRGLDLAVGVARDHHLREGGAGSHWHGIIRVPPRHLKSIIASVALPAWYLGHNPSERVIAVSYLAELARTVDAGSGGCFAAGSERGLCSPVRSRLDHIVIQQVGRAP